MSVNGVGKGRSFVHGGFSFYWHKHATCEIYGQTHRGRDTVMVVVVVVCGEVQLGSYQAVALVAQGALLLPCHGSPSCPPTHDGLGFKP
eukprot:362188-Chlamydomonas_euryale.AAC.2